MPLDKKELEPLDISSMTLDDVDKVSHTILRTSLDSVIRRKLPDTLMHQSHRSHGSKIGSPDDPEENLL